VSAYRSGQKARDRLRQRLKEQQQGLCALCGIPIAQNEFISIDHIIPKSRGGSDATPNLQAAHTICNNMRGRRER
jgi:5-methylcytosine-specific restriction protein A